MLNPAKEEILKKVRRALIRKNPMPQGIDFTKDIYARSSETDNTVLFAENLVVNKGSFIYCESLAQFRFLFQDWMKERKASAFAWEPFIREAIGDASQLSEGDVGFKESEIGITGCEFLIARTGSVLYSTGTEAGRRLSIYPPVHVVVAWSSQIVYDIGDALRILRIRYLDKMPSMICLETGPSRTADIEKTLVLGAHGPKELIVFLIDDSDDHTA
jgi:L-lactate dehydrogenase complex protein LldG